MDATRLAFAIYIGSIHFQRRKNDIEIYCSRHRQIAGAIRMMLVAGAAYCPPKNQLWSKPAGDGIDHSFLEVDDAVVEPADDRAGDLHRTMFDDPVGIPI
jgi:hypothetical protein